MVLSRGPLLTRRCDTGGGRRFWFDDLALGEPYSKAATVETYLETARSNT